MDIYLTYEEFAPERTTPSSGFDDNDYRGGRPLMIDGVITFKDIVRHPIVMIRSYGFSQYCRFLWKGTSRRRYKFVQIIFPFNCDNDTPQQ